VEVGNVTGGQVIGTQVDEHGGDTHGDPIRDAPYLQVLAFNARTESCLPKSAVVT
jgi:hypothetical protein